MQLIDGIILVIILLSVIIGLFRGFLMEAIALISWILAIWIAIRFSESMTVFVPSGVESSMLRLVIAFVALFVVVLIAGKILSFVVSKLASKTGLTGTDRILGFVFGALRGGVIVTVLALLAQSFTDMEEQPWWAESISLPFFEALAEQLKDRLPVTWQERLDPPSGRLAPGHLAPEVPSPRGPIDADPVESEGAEIEIPNDTEPPEAI